MSNANGMPLDTGLLYGGSAASGLLHVAAVVGLSMIAGSLGRSPWVLLALVAAASFLIHFLVFLTLQAQSCDGVKNFSRIAQGAAVGTGTVVAMSCVPLFLESARLVVSQLGGPHLPLADKEMAARDMAVAKAALESVSDFNTNPAEAVTRLSLSPDDYAAQTFREQVAGMSYWAAFGGLYGVGLGSLLAGECK